MISTFSPGNSRQMFNFRKGYIAALPFFCGCSALYDATEKFFQYGVISLTAGELQLLACTSITSVIDVWHRRPRHHTRDKNWEGYLDYLVQMARFGEECWILAHASLCWVFTPSHESTAAPSERIFYGRLWEKMISLRHQFVRRLQRYHPSSLSPLSLSFFSGDGRRWRVLVKLRRYLDHVLLQRVCSTTPPYSLFPFSSTYSAICT
jgi:hypothetical protein